MSKFTLFNPIRTEDVVSNPSLSNGFCSLAENPLLYLNLSRKYPSEEKNRNWILHTFSYTFWKQTFSVDGLLRNKTSN